MRSWMSEEWRVSLEDGESVLKGEHGEEYA